MRRVIGFLTLAVSMLTIDVSQAQNLGPIDIAAVRARVQHGLDRAAASPEIAEAVKAQNGRTIPLTETEIENLRAVWHGERLLRDRPLITTVTTAQPALRLKAIAAAEGDLLGPVFVTDARGLLVASNVESQDYRINYGNIWKSVFLAPPGRVIVTPTNTGTPDAMYASIGIRSSATGDVIGIVSTLIVVPRLPAPQLAEEQSDEFQMGRPEKLIDGLNPMETIASVN